LIYAVLVKIHRLGKTIQSAIVRNDNKTITILATQPVVSFKICDLKGRVVNHSVTLTGNIVSLYGMNGAILQSGKYILNYKLADGFETSSAFCVK
jgi:hypothetical protein